MARDSDSASAAFCLQVHAGVLKVLGISEPPYELTLDPRDGAIAVNLQDFTQTTADGAPRQIAAFQISDRESNPQALALVIADRLRAAL